MDETISRFLTQDATSSEVHAVTDLVGIGAVVFKDSRNITADEAAIVRAVYKKKFSKI